MPVPVQYYCTPSTENVPLERQRSTGMTLFGGGFDYRSVRYFCPALCEHLPPEPERDTGLRTFIGTAYGEQDAEYRVNPVPELGNLSDVRVVSGCHYYGFGRCAALRRSTNQRVQPLKQTLTVIFLHSEESAKRKNVRSLTVLMRNYARGIKD